MTAKVAARFNENLRDYLPNIDKAVKSFKQFKEQIEMKFDQVKKDADDIKSYQVDLTALKDLKFDCTIMKNDIDLQKRNFTQTFKTNIEKDSQALKELREDMKLVNLREESYAKMSETDRILRELNYYCKKNDMLDFRHDMKDVAKIKDIDVIRYELN